MLDPKTIKRVLLVKTQTLSRVYKNWFQHLPRGGLKSRIWMARTTVDPGHAEGVGLGSIRVAASGFTV